MALHPSMTAALRLTRAGNLTEATRLIQTMLAGGAPAPGEPPAAEDAVIDLTPTRATVAPLPDARKRSAPGPQPSEGSFLERSCRGSGGALDYRLYLPAGAAPGMPLVVMLHGCTQSPEDFARGTRMNALADEFGVIVAYPRQTSSANMQKCWNWFRTGDQQRDAGEPALIAGIVRQLVAEERADPRRVYAAGLSAGGAAAAIVAERYPDLFAAVGIHSGLACGAAHDLTSALAAMKKGGRAARAAAGFVPTITFHGDRDTTVHELNSREIVGRATAALGMPLETRLETGTSDGGRGYTRALGVDGSGTIRLEQWTIHGAGHAWSGGDPAGSYTDPAGPDASRAMLRFFLGHELAS